MYLFFFGRSLYWECIHYPQMHTDYSFWSTCCGTFQCTSNFWSGYISVEMCHRSLSWPCSRKFFTIVNICFILVSIAINSLSLWFSIQLYERLSVIIQVTQYNNDYLEFCWKIIFFFREETFAQQVWKISSIYSAPSSKWMNLLSFLF